ncbi:MFS general substrate transporter, partial [Trichocladium antarcticum]
NLPPALRQAFCQCDRITQFQFNIGQQLLSAGIVILEIPSNLVLYKLGPALWIGPQIIAWGLVATFQAFQKGLGPYLATRLLLGLCEAGFIPAGLYTITRWYKREETTKRFSYYFLGMMVSAASSGLIAFGILHMRGVCGLAGWQWLNVHPNLRYVQIEGVFTIIVGILFFSLLPQSPLNPVSLFGIRYFSEREAQILQQRVLRDDPSKVQTRETVSAAEVKATFTNWRLLPHFFMTLSGMAPGQAMATYAPSLVVSFGFDRLKANAMMSIGAWFMVLTTVIWGIIADKTRRRGLMVFLGVLGFWGLTLGNRLLITSKNGNLRFGFLAATTAFQANWHPVNGAWLALNAKTSGERSLTMAIFIIGANISGIIGGQIFQAEDAPMYRTAWTVIMSLASLALAMSVFANAQYWLLNRLQKRKGEDRYLY